MRPSRFRVYNLFPVIANQVREKSTDVFVAQFLLSNIKAYIIKNTLYIPIVFSEGENLFYWLIIKRIIFERFTWIKIDENKDFAVHGIITNLYVYKYI